MPKDILAEIYSQQILLEKNLYYKLNKEDKQALMYDFYTLTLLYTIAGGLVPGSKQLDRIQDESLKESLREAVEDELLPKLKQHMLKAVAFAISAEFRHLFDNNSDKKILQWAESHNNKDFIQKYYQSLITRKAFENIPSSKKGLLPASTTKEDRRFKEDRDSYRNSWNALLDAKVKLPTFAYMAEDAFKNLKWASMYGGNAWAQIAAAWTKLYKAEEPGDIMAYIDHIYDLQHNTDTVFNKLKAYYDRNTGYDWIRHALDFKASVRTPWRLVDKASPIIKSFVAYLGKDLGFGTKEDFAKSLNKIEWEEYHDKVAKASGKGYSWQGPKPKGPDPKNPEQDSTSNDSPSWTSPQNFIKDADYDQKDLKTTKDGNDWMVPGTNKTVLKVWRRLEYKYHKHDWEVVALVESNDYIKGFTVYNEFGNIAQTLDIHGNLNSFDDKPADISYKTTKDDNQKIEVESWYKGGARHRENGPATIFHTMKNPDGSKKEIWYQNGFKINPATNASREPGFLGVDIGDYSRHDLDTAIDGENIVVSSENKTFYKIWRKLKIKFENTSSQVNIYMDDNSTWPKPPTTKDVGLETEAKGFVIENEHDLTAETLDIFGNRHSFDDTPAVITYKTTDDDNLEIQVEKWYKHGKLHRDFKPAVIFHNIKNPDGSKKELYYLNGEETQPPISLKSSKAGNQTSKKYKFKTTAELSDYIAHTLDIEGGKSHVYDKDQDEHGVEVLNIKSPTFKYLGFNLNGDLHSFNGKPAKIFNTGVKEWYKDGKLHNEAGPAVEYSNGDKEYYLDGKKYSKEVWEKKVKEIVPKSLEDVYADVAKTGDKTSTSKYKPGDELDASDPIVKGAFNFLKGEYSKYGHVVLFLYGNKNKVKGISISNYKGYVIATFNLNGNHHSFDNKPSLITFKNNSDSYKSKSWHADGLLHNTQGPAVIIYTDNGNKESYYIAGNEISKEEWEKKWKKPGINLDLFDDEEALNKGLTEPLDSNAGNFNKPGQSIKETLIDLQDENKPNKVEYMRNSIGVVVGFVITPEGPGSWPESHLETLDLQKSPHSFDGHPARITHYSSSDGSRTEYVWYKHGRLHNTKGPAIILSYPGNQNIYEFYIAGYKYPSKYAKFYIDGKLYTETEYVKHGSVGGSPLYKTNPNDSGVSNDSGDDDLPDLTKIDPLKESVRPTFKKYVAFRKR